MCKLDYRLGWIGSVTILPSKRLQKAGEEVQG